jgi:hypothetical protein
MAENGIKHQKSNQINQPDKHGVFLITTMLTDLNIVPTMGNILMNV